jgi:thymidine kinase
MAKLYFYYSAMNAGKTTTLLQSAYNYHERGMRTLILKPGIDTRGDAELQPSGDRGVPPSGPSGHLPPQAGEGALASPAATGFSMVASRIGLKAVAQRVDGEADLLARVQADIAQSGPLHCVLVDEAQFLTRSQAWQLTDIVDVLGIPVLAYGLRTDFRGELFEGSRHLLAWADNLEEIKTICHTGRKATMVVRVDADGRAITEGPQVEIGGNERYVSVSRAEFKKVTRGEGRIELQKDRMR